MDAHTQGREVRVAASALLEDVNRNRENSTRSARLDPNVIIPPISSHYSINTAPLDENLVEGVEVEGRISPVRRFFCLFVIFDLSFTSLLWLICLVIGTGGRYKEEMKFQVVDYSIYTSLFDIVLTALCRTVLLLLMYALLRINHWWIVAITTAGSSAFLIAKIFYFLWQNDKYNNNYYVFSIILVLCSFVISWGECWFMDFRVIPQETAAKQILRRNVDRSPHLIHTQRFLSCYGSVGDGTETLPFYSPLQSHDVSEDEEEVFSDDARIQHNIRCQEFKQKGKEVTEAAYNLFMAEDWKLQKVASNGDTMFIKQIAQPRKGKVFKLKCAVPIEPRYLLNDIFYNVEAVSKWNPTVNSSKIIETIDDHTDITHQVVNELANGVISSRDFVNLRHWETRNNGYLIGVCAIEHPSMPALKRIIRGENGVSGCYITPFDDGCELQMLFHVDLKGWLPQSIVDQTMITVSLEYAECLRKHVQTLSETQSI